jgi:hypothetical protein
VCVPGNSLIFKLYVNRVGKIKMDDNTLRKIIEDKISALSSNFQDFCDRLGLKLYPNDYTPVRAGGPKGDMSNDGYCPKLRIFFAAHATRGEEISKMKLKIKSDLEGCISKHPDVKQWIFLTNDTLLGEVETFIDELRRDNESVVIETWGHKIIANKISELPKSDIAYILDMNFGTSYELDEAINEKEREVINEIFEGVIAHLRDGKERINKERINLEDKIKLNFKDESDREAVRKYFLYALTKVDLVEQRIRQEDGDIQNDLHSHMFNKYYELKLRNSTNILILHQLFEMFVPARKEKSPVYLNLARAFVLFFFDDCTIFEKTNEEKKS